MVLVTADKNEVIHKVDVGDGDGDNSDNNEDEWMINEGLYRLR